MRTHLRHVAAHLHPETLMQPFLRDRAGGDPHRRLARRGTPAAAIIADAVLVAIHVVGMSRAKRIGNVGVIFAALILVADEQRDRCPGRAALEYAGEDLHRVGFAPLRNMARGAGLAPVELALNVGGGELHAGRATIDDTTDGGTVRFAEGSDAKKFAEGIAGHVFRSVNVAAV